MQDTHAHVSVVIPTYNRAATLVRAVRSALGQTHGPVTIHVVDDGSTDDTSEVIRPLLTDPRLDYCYQDNQGQSAARNVGIARAEGDFIAFLDSDNYWLPSKLSDQLAYLARFPDHQIVYSDGHVVDEHDRRLPAGRVRRYSGDIVSYLVQGNFVSNNTALARRECFEDMGGFDERLRVSEDYDLWLRFSTRYRFLYHPEPVACYCVAGPRLSNNEIAVLEANFLILSRFFETFPDACTAKDRKSAWARYFRWRSSSMKRLGEGYPWADLLRAVKLAPFDGQNYRLMAKMFAGRC